MINLKRYSVTYQGVIESAINILIILSVISFSIETIPNLPNEVSITLKVINFVTITVFSIEYVLRVILAENKTKYIFSFSGIIDLVAILPFYLAQGLDLRSLRIFRLLRLAKILKLTRLQKAMDRIKTALVDVMDELQVFGILMLFILYLSSVGIYYFENPVQPEVFSSIFTSLWWSVTSLTTVGYGDMYPITVGGKIFTMLVLLVGLAVVAIPTGIIASSLESK